MFYAQLLFPDFSLILIGYLICRYTALNRTVWEQVESLVFYFLFPVLLFHSIARSPLDLVAASGLIAAALCLVGLSVMLAYALAWLPHVDARTHAAGAQVAFRFNSFIALALAEKLGGAQGLLLIAIIIGVCVPLCNIGAIYPMAKQSGAGFVKSLLTNPLVIGTAGGLLANILGFSFPLWLEPTVTRIGQASLALGLMACGAGMQWGHTFSSPARRSLGVGVLLIRHMAMPLLAWVMVQVFELSPAHATALYIYSALPTASSCYVLASKMGYDAVPVAGLVTVSTILGVLSLPFALGVLR